MRTARRARSSTKLDAQLAVETPLDRETNFIHSRRSTNHTKLAKIGPIDEKIIGLTGKKGTGSPYSIAERRVPELIPVLGSQPAGKVSHKPRGRLPLLSARPAVILTTLKRAAASFAAW